MTTVTTTDEDSLRQMYDAVACGVVVVDPDGTIVEANRAVEEIWGVRADEVRGRPLVTLAGTVVAEDGTELPPAARPTATAARTRKPVRNVVFRLTRLDGARRWVQADAVPLLDAEGTVQRVIASFVDITARKDIEEALAVREARYRALSEHASDIVAVLGPDGTIRYASPSHYRILGHQPEDIVGTSVLAWTHPDDRDRAQSAVAACLVEARGTSRVESRLRHADGRWVPLESIADNRLDDPAIGGVVITSRDVTERIRAEEALRASEARLGTIVVDAPIVLTTIDTAGVVTLSEGRGLEAIGRAPNATAGQSMFDLFRDTPDVLDALRGALAGEETTSVATLRGRVFEAHYSPARDAAGTVREVIAVATDVTERVRAEEARQESEARYRALAEHGSDLVAIVDKRGVIHYASPSHATILGLSPALAEGQVVLDHVHRDDRPRVETAFQDCLERREGGRVTIRMRLRRADGAWLTVESALDNHLDDPAVRGVIAVSRDVSAYVQAEEALREDTARLASVVATQQDVALADLDTQVVLPLIAARARALTAADGAVVELAEGDDLVYHAADGTMEEYLGTRLPLEGTLSGLAVRTGETLHCADAATDPRTDPALCRRLRIGSMIAVPLRHGGAVVGVLKVLSATSHSFNERDVRTLQLMAGVLGAALGQSAAFTALRESEQRLQTVIGNAPIVLTAIDAAGIVTFSTGGGTEKIGRAPHSTVGQSIFDVTADAPKAHDYIRRALAGEACTATIHLRGAVFETHYAPLRDETGRVSGAIGVATDITERARAEEALAAKRVELERSNAELQQFAYVASHDLQEPLRTIASYLQLLKRRYQGKVLDEGADEYMAFAVDGAKRMQALIQAVLAYSRVGTQGKEFAPVACRDLVAGAVANLKARIADTRARVTYEDLPMVSGDGAQLGQLFQNLIGNALKFCRQTPEITVTAARRGAEWVIAVRDNGIGIPPDQGERIFQMFQRLHTREEYEGTGIGLPVCKKIVERHGGRIWVESRPGEGATFLFTLPALEESADIAA